MLKTLWIIFFLIVTNQSHAKSKCEFEWKQLKSIQSLLRQKSTEYLRKKEHEKHNEYQNCRKNKNNSKSSQNTKNNYSDNLQYYASQYKRNTFKNSPIQMKAKFKGEKQEAWIQSYITPKDCIKPKKISKFASCLSNRDIAAEKFNIQWNNKHQ